MFRTQKSIASAKVQDWISVVSKAAHCTHVKHVLTFWTEEPETHTAHNCSVMEQTLRTRVQDLVRSRSWGCGISCFEDAFRACRKRASSFDALLAPRVRSNAIFPPPHPSPTMVRRRLCMQEEALQRSQCRPRSRKILAHTLLQMKGIVRSSVLDEQDHKYRTKLLDSLLLPPQSLNS
jgi:hypothetical protein